MLPGDVLCQQLRGTTSYDCSALHAELSLKLSTALSSILTFLTVTSPLHIQSETLHTSEVIQCTNLLCGHSPVYVKGSGARKHKKQRASNILDHFLVQILAQNRPP